MDFIYGWTYVSKITPLMQKIIVLSYYFPPCNLTSAERVKAWAQYFKKAGLYPIIISRNWDRPIRNFGDTFIAAENGNQIEKYDDYEVHYINYKPNFKERIFGSLTGTPIYFIYLIIAFFSSISQLVFLRRTSMFDFYHYCQELLVRNSDIKKIIVSASPFEMFGIAYYLAKKHDIKWIADYRDDWSTSDLHNGNMARRALNKVFSKYEKKWVSTASFFTTVSAYYVSKINSLLNIPGYEIQNGFTPANYYKTEPLYPDFTITYIGSIYPTQPIELFLNSIIEFIKKQPESSAIKIKFIGIKNEANVINRILPLIKGYESHFHFTERIPKEDAIKTQLSSHCLLICAHSNLKGIPSSKIYEYLATKKHVLVYPSDGDIVEKILTESGQGIFCRTNIEFMEQLSYLYSLYKANKFPSQTTVHEENINSYTRENFTLKLAKLINSLDTTSDDIENIKRISKNKVLIVAIQRSNLTVGGMAYRFSNLWQYLNSHNENVYLLTSKSLVDKFNFNIKNKNLIVINDYHNWKYIPTMLFISPILFFLKLKYKIQSIHLATLGWYFIPFFAVAKLLRIKNSITFASNSLEMAAYNNPKAKKQWDTILKMAQNVDILNPTNSLYYYNFRRFISPNSFPHLTNTNKPIPFSFNNPNRKNIIIFCGAFEQTKNPILAIEAFALFLEKHFHEFNQPKLVLFGKGSLEAQIKNAMNHISAKFGDVIEIREYSRYLETLSESRIFLSLQDFDNYPSQSLMESMLFCNKIIATNYGDTHLLVYPEGNKLINTTNNPNELAECMAELLKDNSIHIGNRELILKKHSIENFADYFLSMQDKIIHSK